MNLDDIKEGDYIALLYGGWSNDVSKLRVTRTTATRIYAGDKAYTRHGYRVGEGSARYARARIAPWHPRHEEMVADTRLRHSRQELLSFAWNTVDQATADAVLAIIKPKETA